MKILVSYGYGAGWSSWAHNRDVEKFVLTYQPIIEFLENGGDSNELDTKFNTSSEKYHSLLKQLEKDIEEKFGKDKSFYMGGAQGLCVEEVNCPFRIDEYDGAESVVLLDEKNYYHPDDF